MSRLASRASVAVLAGLALAGVAALYLLVGRLFAPGPDSLEAMDIVWVAVRTVDPAPAAAAPCTTELVDRDRTLEVTLTAGNQGQVCAVQATIHQRGSIPGRVTALTVANPAGPLVAVRTCDGKAGATGNVINAVVGADRTCETKATMNGSIAADSPSRFSLTLVFGSAVGYQQFVLGQATGLLPAPAPIPALDFGQPPPPSTQAPPSPTQPPNSRPRATPTPTPSRTFSLTATPASQTVTQGGRTTYTVSVNPTGGFTGAVMLSASGLPASATGSFAPNPITGSTPSTLTVATAATTPTGTFTLTITGVSGALTRTAAVRLVVNPRPDFALSATPTSQTVTQGGRTTYTVSVNPTGGFTGAVMLSASGLPASATGSFAPNPVTAPTPSTLTVATAATTPTGTFTLTITGVSGALTRTAAVRLVVNPRPDFALSATPTSQTVTQGGRTTYTVSVNPTGGFTGAVMLSVSGLPASATGSFAPNPITGSTPSTLTVATATTTPTGTFALTITGVSGALTHTTTVTLIVVR